MPYRIHITLTEDDFFAYNWFQAYTSPNGSRGLKNYRILYVVLYIMIALFVIMLEGITTFTVVFLCLVGLGVLICQYQLKDSMFRRMKENIRKQQAKGRIFYSPEASMEFHEDRFIVICPDKTIIQAYTTLERISVIGDKMLYLHQDMINAFLVPIAQIKDQVDYEAFMALLSEKCNLIDRYE